MDPSPGFSNQFTFQAGLRAQALSMKSDIDAGFAAAISAYSS